MSLSITLPQNYGYAALIAVGIIPILSFVQGSIVTSYRKAAGVAYPTPYATAEQAKTNRAAYQFNCAQRAHGNLLENMTQTMAGILFAGLFYPNAAAGTGAAWVFFRALYTYGYITSEVNGKGRSIGSGMWFCQLGLLGMSIAGAVKMIGNSI